MSYSNLLYHCVFSTKNRLPLINENLKSDLYSYIGGIVRSHGGALLEIGGMPDHVHLLARFKPTISVSDMLREIKSGSSKWANEEKPGLHKFGWQDGYAAFTVSRSQVEQVRTYIRNQAEHHLGMDYMAELVELLEKHEIEYDERYLWG